MQLSNSACRPLHHTGRACGQRRFRPTVCLPILLLLSTIGCSADPPLSPLAFQYAEAALGVCTRRAANAVPPLLQRIDTAVKQQELTEREAQPLREILTSAETQQWEQATRAARALLNRQAQARTLP